MNISLPNHNNINVVELPSQTIDFDLNYVKIIEIFCSHLFNALKWNKINCSDQNRIMLLIPDNSRFSFFANIAKNELQISIYWRISKSLNNWINKLRIMNAKTLILVRKYNQLFVFLFIQNFPFRYLFGCTSL